MTARFPENDIISLGRRARTFRSRRKHRPRSIGTAVLLNRIDGGGPLDLVIEEGIGPVRCTTVPIDGERGRARFQLPQLPEETGQAADKETIAAALALSPDDIGFEGSQPSFWSAGISFAFVPVRGREAIRRCQPRLEYWDAAFTRSGLCLLR